MDNKEKNNLLNLLIENNENRIKEFIFLKGKEPKATCPIRFVKDKENL